MQKFIPYFLIASLLGLGLFFANKMMQKQPDKIEMPTYDNGETYTYKFQNGTFSLTARKEYRSLPPDSLPWVPPGSNKTENGLITCFVANGVRPALNKPYIQVAYISRKMKGFSKPDSAMMWADETILRQPNSKIIKPLNRTSTISGREAVCKEYAWGERKVYDGVVAARYVAYAYLEHNQDYLLALTLTTLDSTEYASNLGDFYYILKSYK